MATSEVILTEKIRGLGDIGETVKVRGGFKRNYLIPYGKAVPATDENREYFAKKVDELQRIAQEKLQQAQERAQDLAQANITISSQAREDGQLYGSIGISDLVKAYHEAGLTLEKSEICLPHGAFRTVGEHEFTVLLHSDITLTLKVNITPQT
jgi:large subunit ribosomal protein L9